MAGAIATCRPSRSAARVSDPVPASDSPISASAAARPGSRTPKTHQPSFAGRADHRVEALQQLGGPIQKIRIDLGTAHEEDRGVIRPGIGERMLRPAGQGQNMHVSGTHAESHHVG